MGMNKAKYALITSFKKEDRYEKKYLSNLFVYSIKAFLYNFINKRKAFLYKNRLKSLILSKGRKLLGHPTLLTSLFRGFDSLKIPFTYNKITKYTENAVILWTDKEEMEIVEKLKKEGKIKKVVTTPCATKTDYVYQYSIVDDPCVDLALVASDWVVDLYKEHVDENNMYKVKPWFSGAEIFKSDKKIKNKIVLYNKRLDIPLEIVDFIKELGIGYEIINYGKYPLYDWIYALLESDFSIFFQDYIETQGIAMAESWAADRPTVIQYNENEYGGHTSPYLCGENGLYFKSLDELKGIISEYNRDKNAFLSKFKPREFMINNLSDEKSVLKLIEYFDSIGEKQ